MPAYMEHLTKQAGDVHGTYADTTKAREELGFDPRVRGAHLSRSGSRLDPSGL